MFLAGLLSFVWNGGHVARDYVARHCLGLEDVVAACGGWSPNDVAAVCGLEAVDIERVFQRVVAGPAVVLDRSGLSMAPHATVTAGLTLAVNASLGRLDVENGLFVPDYSAVRGNAIHGRPAGARYGREWPSALLATAILGGDRPPTPSGLPEVKALIVVGGNPAQEPSQFRACRRSLVLPRSARGRRDISHRYRPSRARGAAGQRSLPARRFQPPERRAHARALSNLDRGGSAAAVRPTRGVVDGGPTGRGLPRGGCR